MINSIILISSLKYLNVYFPLFLLISFYLLEQEFAGLAFWSALDDEAVRMVETAAVKVVIR